MKENILFFYKNSHGELYAGLPFVLEIIKDKRYLNYYFVCNDKNKFNSIPKYYRDIINEYFEIVEINKVNIIKLFLNNFLSNNYIFTCDNGHSIYTRILTCYWPFSRIVFFHHAYALLNGNLDDQRLELLQSNIDNFNGYHHKPLVIAHNNNEIIYRKNQKFLDKNIIVAGNIGYRKNWISILSNKSEEVKKIHQVIKEYSQTIFIPVRDTHSQYLTSLNAEYLFNSIIEFFDKYPEYLFLVKVHPRQNKLNEFIKLETNYPNVRLVYVNTTVAAQVSDLTISYWSSAITDSIAVGTPTIEFHRHDFFHMQLVNTNDGLVSLYNYYGLCPFYTDKDKVLDLLATPSEWTNIGENQSKIFQGIFPKDQSLNVENLFERIDATPFRKRYLIDFFKPTLLILNKIAFHTYKSITGKYKKLNLN